MRCWLDCAYAFLPFACPTNASQQRKREEEAQVGVGVRKNGGDDARDRDPSGAQLVCDHVGPHGIVHRWICNDGKFADESGAWG